MLAYTGTWRYLIMAHAAIAWPLWIASLWISELYLALLLFCLKLESQEMDYETL